MADAGVDDIKLREVQRELQRKIDKAKPVVSQHEAGELKVLSDAQKRMIDAYPGYLADMAEVKAGRMPAVRAAKPQPKQAAGNPDADGAAEDDSGKTGKQLKRERAAARKAAKEGGAKGTPSKGKKASSGPAEPTGPLSEHERFVHSVAKATGATRKALVDSFVSGKVNRSRLVELEREYDAVCQLRREILSGTIAQPTKLQQSKVQLAEALKHDVEAEQAALRSQGDRHRIFLMAEVEELEAQHEADDAAEDEAESMTESPPPEAEAEEAPKQEEEPTPAAAEEEEEDATETPAAAAAAAEEVAEEAAAEAEVEEEAAKAESVASEPEAKEAEKEVVAEVPEETPAETEEQDAEVVAAAAVAEAPAEEEPAKDPTPPPPPRSPTPPPKPIDWNEVVITKNRRTIAAPNKRGASPVDASRRDRSSSPAAVAARSPTDSAPAKPTTMPSLMYTAADSATSAPAKAASPKKGGKPPAASAFRQSAAARLQREFAECAAAQATLPAVACALVADDVFRWAVNVAVADGPLAGLIVPLEVVFSDFYPQEAPLIKALVEVPHPSIVPSAGARNSLCLEHTATISPKDVTPMRGWSPAYGAFSVLSQLQGFFAKENFAKLEKTLGAKVFAGRIRTTRIAIANFVSAATGHTPARPVPAVPMLNGPLRHAPEAVLLRGGAIRCRAAGEGNVWQHAYGRDGVHRFRATLRGGSAVIGVTVDGDQADQSKLGKVDGSWAFDTATGSLWAEGKQTAVADEAAQFFPLPGGATVDVTVRPKEGTITFAAHGEAFVREVSGIETTGPFIPAYCLLSAQAAAELAFYVAGTTVPPPSSYGPAADAGNSGADTTDAPSSSEGSPNAPAPAAGGMAGYARASPRCAVSLRGANEGALICLGIEVSKRHRTHLPAEMHATGSYVAHECFSKVSGQRAPSGYRYDVALPLLLDAEHSKRALPQLKKTLTHMCRNPLASTLYDPPFRPQLACAIFAELLRGVIRDVLHSRSPDHAEAFVLYCRLVHGFAALAAETPAIVKEARGTIAMGECSATVVFAVSTVVVEEPWPEIVSRAIRAEFGGREPETDAEGFALLKRALPKLLIGGAMARAVRFASLPRAVEVLASNAGAPSDEIAAEALGAIASRGSVNSWEAMCDFFGVSTSAADVAAAV